MTLMYNNTSLFRRFSTIALTLLLASFISIGFGQTASAKTLDAPTGASAPVNVPAAILYIGCDPIRSLTVSVDFYYVRLDGSVYQRTATVDSGGLTTNSGAPTIQFYNLSLDYADYNVLYEFNLSNGKIFDVYATPANWGRDARNGNIWATFTC